jgi:hypothetical protein
VSLQGILVIVDKIFKDVMKEAIELLFQKEWYEQRLVEAVILTMEDYFNEIEGTVTESYFRKLVPNLKILPSDYFFRLVNVWKD